MASAWSDRAGRARDDERQDRHLPVVRPWPGPRGGRVLCRDLPDSHVDQAVSFQVLTDDQAETDRHWNAIVDGGGRESACGWCKDRWGFSWQIVPRAMMAALTQSDKAAAKRAFQALMTMRKIDIAAIEAASAEP